MTESNALVWEEGMGEISGFGGGYEATCRRMLANGVAWLRAHPDADPRFRGYAGVYGFVVEDNDDAKALSAAVVEGEDDITGAMHHAVVQHTLAVARLGWEGYVAEMKKPSGEPS